MDFFGVLNPTCTFRAFEKLVGNSPGFFEIDNIVLFLASDYLASFKFFLYIRDQNETLNMIVHRSNIVWRDGKL